jgi:hypothetical protein
LHNQIDAKPNICKTTTTMQCKIFHKNILKEITMGITSLKLLHGFLLTKTRSIQGFKPAPTYKLKILKM